jgi:pimeloyl-ACP methyl ester carboxylesterase
LFLNVNGTRLHYSDRGEGTPIVLIHGNAVCSATALMAGWRQDRMAG